MIFMNLFWQIAVNINIELQKLGKNNMFMCLKLIFSSSYFIIALTFWNITEQSKKEERKITKNMRGFLIRKNYSKLVAQPVWNTQN